MAEGQGEKGFEGLACYQHGLRLFEAAYRLAARLPAHERYNLTDQLRRAALSVLLNIAEGYGRYHYLDKLRFFYIARGSLCETLSGFIAAHQAGYIEDQQLAWARSVEAETEKSLNGYIGFLRKQQQGGVEYGYKLLHEDGSEYHVSLLVGNTQPNPVDPDSWFLIPGHPIPKDEYRSQTNDLQEQESCGRRHRRQLADQRRQASVGRRPISSRQRNHLPHR